MPQLAGSCPPGVEACRDEYHAAEGAEALVLATEWNQFRGLDLERVSQLLREPVVIDLRNVYEPEAMRRRGFRYTGVGR
jgi:UDPglucose 6-dehydrogenase